MALQSMRTPRGQRSKRSQVKSYFKTSVDANEVDSEKRKKAMIMEMDNRRELKVYTDVEAKSLKSEEGPRIIDSRCDL
eukprot:3971423-Amphidinium_carterae.4